MSNADDIRWQQRVHGNSVDAMPNPWPPFIRGGISAIQLLKLDAKGAGQFPFARIAKNTLENQQLTQLRGWLLPMLMNGQVTVK